VSQAKAAERTGQHAAALEDLAAARRWGASSAALDAANLSPRAPAAPTAAQLAQVARQLRRIHYVPPRYPQRALASGLSGEVTVRYVVDAHGHTRQLQVIAARPGTLFNRAALAAIRRWRYTPPTFDGRPIAVPVMTQIRFELPN
jgi:protein TonB